MTMMNMTMGVISNSSTSSSRASKSDEHGGKNGQDLPKKEFDEAFMAKPERHSPRMQRGDEAATSLRDLMLSIIIEDETLSQQDLASDSNLSEPQDSQLTSEAVPAMPLTVITMKPPAAIPGQEMPLQLAPAFYERINNSVPPPETRFASDPGNVVSPSRITATPERLNIDTGGKLAIPAMQSDNPASHRSQILQGPPPSFQRVEPVMATERIGDVSQTRISALGYNTIAAPAPAVALGTTAAGLISSIEAEPTWRAAAEAHANASQRGSNLHSTSILRIQLNPAELGMVNVRMVASQAQLSVEIKVESSTARQRLTNDSDAIVKALRAIGFDIDRVTIQQTSQSSGTTAQNGSGNGRDDQMQEQQRADTNSGGRNSNESAEDAQTTRRMAHETADDISGSDVYI